MIEAMTSATEATRAAGAPASAGAAPAGTSGDFGDVYADAAASPTGACQCDRTTSVQNTPNTIAPARTGPLPSIGVERTDEVDPMRTPACGECGLPFVLPDDVQTTVRAPADQSLVPLIAANWTTFTRNWIRRTD